MHKTVRSLVIAAALACGVVAGGCGQKGALVLPDDAGESPTVDPENIELPEGIEDLVDDIERRKPS